MSIATERFLAVVRQSSGVHMITFILPSMLFSILINIPKFFETELVHQYLTDEANNTYQVMEIEITSLRQDPDYIYYYIYWTRLLCTGVIPFIFLSSMNILIYFYVRKKIPSSSICSQNSHSDMEHITNVRKNTSNAAGTLTAIVLMYLICNTPRLVLNIAEYILYPDIYDFDSCGCSLPPTWLVILCGISHLLLTINSSINFLIYFSFGKSFKRIVYGMFKC